MPHGFDKTADTNGMADLAARTRYRQCPDQREKGKQGIAGKASNGKMQTMCD